MNPLQSNTADDQIWLGLVPGQRLPTNFLLMDANELRQLFVTSLVPADVWEAANRLFDGNEQSCVNWLCHTAVGLGGLRPIDAIKTANGKNAVINLIGQLTYGIFP